MAKPINVEAQRVCKILDDLVEKLEVTSHLTSELFTNIIAQDLSLDQLFSYELKNQLQYHAQLERSFKENNLTIDHKIMPDDDQQMTDEYRATSKKLQKSTSKLIRLILKDKEENLHNLRRLDDHRSTDMADFLNYVTKMRDLWRIKLSTSLEEQNGKDQVVEELTTKNKNLRKRLKEKQTAFANFQQKTDERREQLENERSKLTTERSSEAMKKEKERERIQNKKQHDKKMKELKEKRDQLQNIYTTELANLTKKEDPENEEKLRKDFDRAENNCRDSILNYDKDMEKNHESLNNLKEQYSKVQEELALVENLYRGKLEEKRRKEEEIMKKQKLEQERDQQIGMLDKAAEWIQAHYRGLITRRAYNKKGKKGRKGKKKG
ncbi:unnamed protein product [Moneuplotes crassus]|uniref:Dynein regulatory complex protein 10 n=1 Tax=Euplotes crassus TaxID=5936 RepID=A0AAD1XHF0_EUPCR|nr:unnamed protein product [Moneuplotes crassus]